MLRLVHIAAETAQFYVILVSLLLSQQMGIMATSGDVHMVTAILFTKFAVEATVWMSLYR